MRKIVSFSGIERSTSLTGTPDGALEHVEGLRPERGAWVATTDNEQKVSESYLQKGNTYLHRIDETCVYVEYLAEAGQIYYRESLSNYPRNILVSPECALTCAYANIGSTLVLILSSPGTISKLVYLAYDCNKHSYSDVSLDYCDNVDFVFQAYDYDPKTATQPLGFTKSGEDWSSVKASLEKVIEGWQEAGYIEGYAYVSAAFELSDGSYAFPSIPQLVYFGTGITTQKDPATVPPAIEDTSPLTGYRRPNGVFIPGRRPMRSFHSEPTKIAIENYFPGGLQMRVASNIPSELVNVGIIKHVAVFVSPVVAREWEYGYSSRDIVRGVMLSNGTYYGPRQTDNNYRRDGDTTSYMSYDDIGIKHVNDGWIPIKFNPNEWLKWVTLHKVATVKLQELSTVWQTIPLPNMNPILQYEMFPVDLGRHTISAKSAFVYNNRLLLGNITTKFWGQNCRTESILGLNHDLNATNYLQVVFRVKTDRATLCINTIPVGYTPVMRETSPELTEPYVLIPYPYHFIYPDSRAYEFEIYLCDLNLTNYKSVCRYSMEASITSNIAYFAFDSRHNQPDAPVYDRKGQIINQKLSAISVPVSRCIPSAAPVQYNPTLTDTNRIQASLLGNPHVFPAKFSYQVGSSEVIALTAACEPTSQGQFGQFPIMAFTNDGVWALELGTGDIFIQRIVPIAHEVTLDGNVAVASNAIFFKTRRGVMALSGREAINLSKPLTDPSDTTSFDNAVFAKALQDNNLYKNVSRITFLDYIASAQLAIDPQTNELIVYNRGQAYCYVFSLLEKRWYIKPRGYAQLIYDHSRLLGSSQDPVTGYVIFEIRQLEQDSNPKGFWLETRPLFARDGLTNIDRLKVDISATGLAGANILVFLFATNGSGDKWGVVAARKITLAANQRLNEILFGHIPGKYKAFKLIVIGDKLLNATISGIEVDTKEPYNGKLR